MALPYNEFTIKLEIVQEILSYNPDCITGLTRGILLDMTVEDLKKKISFLNEAYGVGCKIDISEEQMCLDCFNLLRPEKTIII